MVASAFDILEAFPLLSNGKIDRRALPAVDFTVSDNEADYVAPRTPIEEVLAGIWCEILGLRRVSVKGNFFELGGHSLLATRLVARVREALQAEVPLRAFFESPTIADLADNIECAKQSDGSLTIPPIRLAPKGIDIPLSMSRRAPRDFRNGSSNRGNSHSILPKTPCCA